MKVAIAGLCVAALCATLAAGAAEAQPRRDVRGPFLLITLPSLGMLTWKCDGHWGFALGYRASPRYATTRVVWQVMGRRVRTQTVQPGDRLEFPFRTAPAQSLTFWQGTGAGTLQAWVVAEFQRNRPTVYCNDYAPPSITARVFPRD